MISNKAVLTRNSAPKLTSFLVKTALFDIMIFWARTSVFYMCVARNEITNFTGPEPVGFLSKEVNKSVTRNRASGGVTKKYFLLKKCMHCLYTKVCQNYYFTIEQLSALVYTPRWVEVVEVLLIKAAKSQKLAKTKKEETIGKCITYAITIMKKDNSEFLSEDLIAEMKQMSPQNLMNILLPNKCEHGH